MAYQNVIITTGTSVMTKFIYSKNTNDQVKLIQGFLRKYQEGQGNRDELSREIISHYRNYYRENSDELAAASAEVSMVDLLEREKKLDEGFVTIKLIHTITDDGILSAKLIKELLEMKYSYTVILVETDEIDVKDRMRLNNQLGKYLNVISEQLRENHPSITCFAPIGGYKILTSLAHLVGTIERYPVLYTYEGSNVIQQIPPIHIKLDYDFFIQNRKLFSKAVQNAFLDFQSLSEEEQAIVRKDLSLFEIIEENGKEYVLLSTLAEYVCSTKLNYLFYPKIYFDRQSFKLVEGKQAWLDAKNEVRKLLDMYGEILSTENELEKDQISTMYSHYLFHSFKGVDLNSSSYRLYKSKNKNVVFRSLWKYVENVNAYYISSIFLHDHDDYERVLANNLNKTLQYTDDDWLDVSKRILT